MFWTCCFLILFPSFSVKILGTGVWEVSIFQDEFYRGKHPIISIFCESRKFHNSFQRNFWLCFCTVSLLTQSKSPCAWYRYLQESDYTVILAFKRWSHSQPYLSPWSSSESYTAWYTRVSADLRCVHQPQPCPTVCTSPTLTPAVCASPVLTPAVCTSPALPPAVCASLSPAPAMCSRSLLSSVRQLNHPCLNHALIIILGNFCPFISLAHLYLIRPTATSNWIFSSVVASFDIGAIFSPTATTDYIFACQKYIDFISLPLPITLFLNIFSYTVTIQNI